VKDSGPPGYGDLIAVKSYHVNGVHYYSVGTAAHVTGNFAGFVWLFSSLFCGRYLSPKTFRRTPFYGRDAKLVFMIGINGVYLLCQRHIAKPAV
jgi:hypothetical protein